MHIKSTGNLKFWSGVLTIQCTFSKENDFSNIVLLSLNWSVTAYMWYLQMDLSIKDIIHFIFL